MRRLQLIFNFFTLKMLIKRSNRIRKRKAIGIALLAMVNPVRITKRGRAVITFNRLRKIILSIISPFYDVRRTKSGNVFINIRKHNRG